MRTGADQQDDVQELTEALQQLQLAQANVQAVLERIGTREQAETTTSQGSGEAVGEARRRTGHPLSSLFEGDRVRINKPRVGQQNTGVVVGATRSALVKVRTPNGEIVKRLTKNLTIIHRS